VNSTDLISNVLEKCKFCVWNP